MNKKLINLFSLGLSSLILTGCFSDNQEIHEWLKEEKKKQYPINTTISEPKKFIAQDYTGAEFVEPFNATKLMQELKNSASAAVDETLLKPHITRRPEALESFPLDSMVMVGSMDKNKERVALIKVDNLIYQVKVGNHLGQNYGTISKITETDIDLLEVVPDSSGDWVHRPATLKLQEKVK